MANPISEQTKTDALKIAKGIQKPGQTKEQTKLISQGIEKGIAEYKKRQKAKARDADKQRKQILKEKQKNEDVIQDDKPKKKGSRSATYLPWSLLILSWLIFAIYLKMFL